MAPQPWETFDAPFRREPTAVALIAIAVAVVAPIVLLLLVIAAVSAVSWLRRWRARRRRSAMRYVVSELPTAGSASRAEGSDDGHRRPR